MAAALGVLKFVRVSSAFCVMAGFLPCYIELYHGRRFRFA